MARFRFSMQNILEMKEKLEDQAKNEFSRANMRLIEAQDERDRLKNRQSKAEEDLTRTVQDVLDVRTIRQKEDAVEILKMYVTQQELVVAQRQQEVNEAREVLNQAMRERKTFEKLREKAFEEFMIEENRKEQKEVDELVSYRYGSAATE